MDGGIYHYAFLHHLQHGEPQRVMPNTSEGGMKVASLAIAICKNSQISGVFPVSSVGAYFTVFPAMPTTFSPTVLPRGRWGKEMDVRRDQGVTFQKSARRLFLGPKPLIDLAETFKQYAVDALLSDDDKPYDGKRGVSVLTRRGLLWSIKEYGLLFLGNGAVFARFHRLNKRLMF